MSLQDNANIERRVAHIVPEALDIPILPSRVGAVTSACPPEYRPGQLPPFLQCKDYVGLLERTGINAATPVRVGSQLQLTSGPVSRRAAVKPRFQRDAPSGRATAPPYSRGLLLAHESRRQRTLPGRRGDG